MSTTELVGEYNRLAAIRNVPPLKAWKDSRVKLFELVSILRTVRPGGPSPASAPAADSKMPLQRRPRGTPIRNAIVEALMVVTHYVERDTRRVVSNKEAMTRDRKTLLSVGLPYTECLERVKAKHPGCKTTLGALRVAAIRARNGLDGYEVFQLPQKRPHRKSKSNAR
ncbi:hypothetical protein JQ608_06905 [Bradyrhizobium liaoningense]|uniref:hypothetical protein n=1 Tax=Bradyrhizobium liaoningense TaxID=43992 RepID=UPI001BA6521E|nr:hypothetical protein [Bradyrhizobium liaoningense]MBR0876931.1 hypothetical protein [Bradyrhizobium liaoningense]